MNIKKLALVILPAVVILPIPLIAMQFSDQVNWSLFDFFVVGVLITGTSFLCQLAASKIKNRTHRRIAAIVILGIFFIVWVQLAVGIVDSWPLAGS